MVEKVMNKSQEMSIIAQAEYYMSDENLKKDSFFHERISSSSDGFIPVDLLLNCNKMKKLTTSKEELTSALKHSKELILSKDGKSFKRKTTTLPELNVSMLNKKKEKKEEEEKTNENDVVIFSIKSTEKTSIKWKVVQEKLLAANHGLAIAYLRFVNNEGHLGLTNKNIKIATNLKIELLPEETESGKAGALEIEKCTSDALIDFWKLHGEHLKMCLNKENSLNRKDKKDKKDKRSKKKDEEEDDENLNKKKKFKLKKPITLGSNKFLDLKDIRQRSRNILNNLKEGEKCSEADTNFLNDVLKYHPNKEKSKNLDYFTCGQNPDYLESKCFILVKKDGSKSDFSVNKCLDSLFEEFGAR